MENPDRMEDSNIPMSPIKRIQEELNLVLSKNATLKLELQNLSVRSYHDWRDENQENHTNISNNHQQTNTFNPFESIFQSSFGMNRRKRKRMSDEYTNPTHPNPKKEKKDLPFKDLLFWISYPIEELTKEERKSLEHNQNITTINGFITSCFSKSDDTTSSTATIINGHHTNNLNSNKNQFEIIKQKILKGGGNVVDNFNDQVTHIIAPPPHLRNNLDDSLNTLLQRLEKYQNQQYNIQQIEQTQTQIYTEKQPQNNCTEISRQQDCIIGEQKEIPTNTSDKKIFVVSKAFVTDGIAYNERPQEERYDFGVISKMTNTKILNEKNENEKEKEKIDETQNLSRKEKVKNMKVGFSEFITQHEIPSRNEIDKMKFESLDVIVGNMHENKNGNENENENEKENENENENEDENEEENNEMAMDNGLGGGEFVTGKEMYKEFIAKLVTKMVEGNGENLDNKKKKIEEKEKEKKISVDEQKSNRSSYGIWDSKVEDVIKVLSASAGRGGAFLFDLLEKEEGEESEKIKMKERISKLQKENESLRERIKEFTANEKES